MKLFFIPTANYSNLNSQQGSFHRVIVNNSQKSQLNMRDFISGFVTGQCIGFNYNKLIINVL